VSVTAVIVCGGRGTRLGPLGDVVNKNVLPVDGVPVVVHAVCTAYEHFGAERCVLLTGHLEHQIEHVLRAYVPEAAVTLMPDPQPTGTAGAVHRAVTAFEIETLLYAHANVALGPEGRTALVDAHQTTSSFWALSAIPIAPTHPRLGPWFSVGLGMLAADVVRAAARRAPLEGETTEAWLFGTELPLHVAGIDIGADWSHVEDLATYRSVSSGPRC
jgi:hypothetical protein